MQRALVGTTTSLLRPVASRRLRYVTARKRGLASAGSGESNNSSKVVLTTGGTFVLVVGATLAARLVYSQLMAGGSDTMTGNPRRDASHVTVHLPSPPSAALPQEHRRLLLKTSNDTENQSKNKGPQLHEIDKQDLMKLLEEQRAILMEAQQKSQEATAQRLRHALQEQALGDASQRISDFCDWYFAYTTTYKLTGLAMASAAQHAVSFGKSEKSSLAAKVSEDLQAHVCRKYEALVLRPAVTDPKVHRAFVQSLHAAHEHYVQALKDVENKTMSKFVPTSTTQPYYTAPPRASDVVIEMDWSAQLQKVQHMPMAYEKSPEVSVALIGGGAAAGKVAGGAAVAKALAAKMATPFATKAAASAAVGKSGAAAATGAAIGTLAGPAGTAVGAAAGAAIGLGVDMGINAGVAWYQREAFEKDVQESLDATRLEWEERLLPELERVQEVWFRHAQETINRLSESAEMKPDKGDE